MKHAALLLVFSLLGLAITGCATSKPYKEPPSLEERFRMADKNKDGKISKQEFAYIMIKDAFDRIDKNNDGVITLDEYLEAGGTVEGFREIDANNDGVITLREATTSKLAMRTMTLPFDGADKDGDGYVSWEELQAYLAEAAPYTR